MRRAVLPALLLFSVASFAATRLPAPQILGLRLGMSYAQAHSRLSEIGQFKSEDEGQQVWTLTHDQRFQYAIIGSTATTRCATLPSSPARMASRSTTRMSEILHRPRALAGRAISATPGNSTTSEPASNTSSLQKAKTSTTWIVMPSSAWGSKTSAKIAIKRAAAHFFVGQACSISFSCFLPGSP